jgi:hypothetical protein
MSMENLLTASALLLFTVAIYVLLINAGIAQDLVKYDSRVRRWLFELKGEYAYFLALGLLWIGPGMQIAAFLLG